MKQFLKYYWLVTLITILIWIFIGWKLGLAALTLTIILTLLEVTLSADNAVVNSRVLVTLSKFWEVMFMTVGILIAVFAVRFILPILIVMVGADVSFGQTLHLALNDPHRYGEELEKAAPLINGFGATFLLLVACEFFINRGRSHSWIKPLERPFIELAKILPGGYLMFAVVIMYIGWLFVPSDQQDTVAKAMIAATLIHTVLTAINYLMEKVQSQQRLKGHKKTGFAAFVAFMYLQVLDASFSLDGVIGAFALTDNIIIIMAGLGAGAVWVREMTLHLVHTGALTTYRYLEHGAHWAIMCLSVIMLLKLYHIHLPEIIIGTIGLICIAFALNSSIRENAKNS